MRRWYDETISLRGAYQIMKAMRYFFGRQKKRVLELIRLAGRKYFISKLPNESLRRLRELRAVYKDCECVIVGNGPSLNKMNLELLEGRYCFFFNGAFDLRRYADPGKAIHVCEDRLVFEDHRTALNNLGGLKFFPSDLIHLVDCSDAIIVEFHRGYCESLRDWPPFVDHESEFPIFYWGGTVAYLALQIAQWMGFSRIHIIGVDLTYSIPESVERDGVVLTSTADDINHYDPGYFGKGLRWHVPRPERMLRAFRKASKLPINNNVTNSGVGGNLNCFDRGTL